MLEIIGVKLTDDIERDKFDKALNYLPDEKKEKIRRFRRYEDSLRALTAEVLIRTVSCSKLSLKSDSLEFKTGPHGKPYLKDYENFHFNLSHSGDWVVCAVSNRLVGIDVEQTKEINLDIAKRFFSREEYDDLSMKKEEERIPYFFDLWTLKESYIKADGRGLAISLSSFSFKIEKDEIIFKTQNELKNCFFRRYDIGKGYKLSVCSLECEFPQNLLIKSFDDIYKELIF